jgi:hypothetical protein
MPSATRRGASIFLNCCRSTAGRTSVRNSTGRCRLWLMNQARSTDLGMALITLLISELRHRRIVVPVLPVLERLTIAARSRARRKAYRALNGDLTLEQRQHLDRLLDLRGESRRQTWLGWLRQAIGAANPNNILACIERLTFIRQLGIPIEWAQRIHQNRFVQIAREGAELMRPICARSVRSVVTPRWLPASSTRPRYSSTRR